MKKLLFCLVFIIMVNFVFAQEQFHITQLTDNNENDISALISGNVAVWLHYDGNDYEVMKWENGVITQLTDDNVDQNDLRIDGNLILWTESGTEDYEIILYNISSESSIQITNDYDYIERSSINLKDNIVVWRASFPSHGSDDTENFMYFYGLTVQLTNNSGNETGPIALGDGVVVWSEYDGNDYEIWEWANFGKLQITDNNVNDINPATDNGIIIWQDNTGIMQYKNNQISQISLQNSQFIKYKNPKIDNEIITWNKFEPMELPQLNGIFVLWHDIIYETPRNFTINYIVSDNMVVWSSQVPGVAPPGACNGTYIWKEGIVTQLSGECSYNCDSNTKNQHIIYSFYDGTDMELFSWTDGIITQITNNDQDDSFSFQPISDWYSIFETYDGNDSEIMLLSYDWTPPILNLSLHDNMENLVANDTWVTNTSVAVSATADDFCINGLVSGVDTTTFEYKIDSGNWIPGSSIQISDEKITTVTFHVKDMAGNLSEQSVTIKIDNTPPSVTFNTSWVANIYTPNITDEGGSGPDTSNSQYSFDGINYYYFPIDFPQTGIYTTHIKLRDQVGNETVISGDIKCDMTGPDITYTQTINPDTGDIILEASAVDAEVGLINTASWENKTGTGSWQPGNVISLSTKVNTVIAFRCADTLGNASTLEEELNIDSQTPEVNVIALAGMNNVTDTWTAEDIIIVSASATDNVGIDPNTWAYIINDMEGTWIPISNPLIGIPIINEGTTTVYYRVSDINGNIGIGNAEVKIDRSAPVYQEFTYLDGNEEVVSEDSNGNTWINTTSISIVPDVTDAVSEVTELKWTTDINLSYTEWNTGTALSTIEGKKSIWFRAYDAAGNSIQQMRYARIDRTNPQVIGVTLDDTYVNNTLNLPIANIETQETPSAVDANGFEYAIDSTAVWSAYTDEISVGYMGEEEHTLYLRCRDLAGNVSPASEGILFIIDRTAPVISSITVKSGNIIIDDNGYSPTTTVQVFLEPSDTYGSGTEGQIAGYWWGVSQVPDGVRFSSELNSLLPEFTINNLSDGINYLYVMPADEAGNEGTMTLRVIRVDSTVPAMPVITSSTHPYAQNLLDAVDLTDAIFSLSCSQAGPSGVAGYEYRILSGTSEPSGDEVPFIPATSNKVEVTLPDNEQEEYYYLQARTISGSGKISAAATYRFRIDTQPPQGLIVTSTTHGSEDHYYASKRAIVQWNRPADFTGVQWFYYTFTTTPVLPDPLPSDYENTGDLTALGWVQTKNLSTEARLNTVTGTDSGIV
ncbi:MAG: hypothetical protein JXJ04_17590, partial [Spirochaetales bacterium]|nr:hypothetical protein [Spirochaetales bacterium]